MAWRIHSRFHSCTSSHVSVHLPLSLARTDGGILAALTDETFDASSGARDRAAEKKKDSLKKSLQSSCSSLIPSTAMRKISWHKEGVGLLSSAILTQIHIAMLTVLVVSETRPLTQTEIIPDSLGCKCGVRKGGLNTTAKRGKGC